MLADLNIISRDFWKSLVHPTPLTFAAVATNAPGRLAITMVLALLVTEVSVLVGLGPYNPAEVIVRFLLIGLFLIPLGLLLWVFFVYKICQNVFHRKKCSYEYLLYALIVVWGVTTTVIMVIGLALSSLPDEVLTVFNWAGWIYPAVLGAIAVHAIARLPLWKSFLTVAISGILAYIGSVVLLLFFLAVLNAVPPGI